LIVEMAADCEATNRTPPNESETQPPEVVWSFRGYRLRASEFTTAMVHLFRAEVTRANVWRQRLDATTNWAVVTTGAAISFTFAAAVSNHFVIILNGLLVTMFLIVEARRYRYYELWSYRVRLMETDFFATMLVPPFHPAADWAEALSENLLHPHFPISMWEAIGRRLRHNYIWIYTVLYIAWLGILWLHPDPAQTMKELAARAMIGPISGWVVLTTVSLFFAFIFALSLGTIRLQQASGEVLPRFGETYIEQPLHAEDGQTGQSRKNEQNIRQAWYRRSWRRPQHITLIVTAHDEIIGKRILSDMKRGVTRLDGVGLYTGEPRPVLMCALTTTEVPHLKALVAELDPQAFVVVLPTKEVLGQGFLPLDEIP
jgi:uncharacterized membrane protein